MKSLTPRRQAYSQKIHLLSGGFSSPTAFPNGEITVYPWDTSVDDWLAERLKKGNRNTLLFDLIPQVCDLNGCPIEQFVVGDVNTVLLVSRSIRYKNLIEYSHQCPHCRAEGEDKIKVPEELGKIGEKGEGYPGFDTITLPDCQDVVKIRPLLVKDELNINARDEASKKLATDHVLHILFPIVEINGGKPDLIDDAVRWYGALSPNDMAFLEEQENVLYPHLDTEIPHNCDACGKSFKHTLDFNQDFFRSSLRPNA